MANKKPANRKSGAGRAVSASVDAGRTRRPVTPKDRQATEGTERTSHERVSGTERRRNVARPGSVLGLAGAEPPEELPPFDESRAVPAEDLAYGSSKTARRARTASTIQPEDS